MSFECTLLGSYLETHEKCEFWISLITADGRSKVIYSISDHLKEHIKANNIYQEEVELTIKFTLARGNFLTRKEEIQNLTVCPASIGWRNITHINIIFKNNNNKTILEVSNLRIFFDVASLVVDNIIGQSGIHMISLSSFSKLDRFYKYLNNVNKARILKAYKQKQEFVDIIKTVYIESRDSFQGTTQVDMPKGSTNSNKMMAFNDVKIIGNITQKPRIHYMLKRYPITKFNTTSEEPTSEEDKDEYVIL